MTSDRAVQSKVAICNLAIRHVGSSKTIVAMTDRTEEARVCAQFFDQVRDEVLRDFPWPFATKTATLALVTAAPTPEWAYAYQYPSDCLKARRVPNGAPGNIPFPNVFGISNATLAIGRIETPQTRVPYRIVGDLIYIDAAPVDPTDSTPGLPQLEYTAEQEDPSQFTADFAQALAFLLATYIAPSITGGDRFKLGDRAQKYYSWAIVRAQRNAVNEEQPDQPPESEAIRSRA